MFRKIAFVGAAAFISTSALAQDTSLAYRGSGTRAGGPAYLLNNPRGPVKAVAVPQSNIPLAYRGSGTRAGGPAYLLNNPKGRLKPVTSPQSKIPLAYRGSGTRAGGPAYLLNNGGQR